MNCAMGSFANEATDVRYSDWVAKLAPPPHLESASEGSDLIFGGPSPLIGKPAPDFRISTLDGSPVELAEFKGKVLILDFWATWCGPCVSELPKLSSVAKQFPTEQVTLLTIDQEEPKDSIEAFLSARQLKVRVGLDSGKLANKFGVDSLPTTVIVDPKGNVAFVRVGAADDTELKLKSAIEKLLDKPTE